MPATEAPPAVVPAKPGPSPEQAAARAAQTTISVSALPKGDLPAAPPKRGTARARLYEQMQKKFGGEPSAPAKTPAPAEAPAPHSPAQPAESSRVSAEATGEKGAGEAPSTEPSPETTPAPAASTTTEAAGTAPETTKDGKRVSPWKLVDQFKDRAAKAEARVLELEKQVPNEAQRKANEAELADLRAKAKEMADELRYHNAEKYDPDVLQAKEAYNRAFNRAMSELKGVSVTDPATQQPRALTVDDLAELAFRPLQEAQSIAKEVFGDLAPYVMDHRNEIRRLWDEQQAKINDLKKNGADREKQRTEAHQAALKKTTEFLSQAYQKANAEIVADPKHGHFFKPREGDPEWNSRLEKGYKFVDETNSLNPTDPNLPPEKRIEAIRRYAASRARSAAFPALRYELSKITKERDAALAELKQYKETTPAAGGRTEAPKTQERPRGMAGLMSDLQKIAH